MATLDMKGPYDLDEKTINSEVTKESAGNYSLGYINDNGKFAVCYVGRSDSDVKDRLLYWAENSSQTSFKFSYAANAKSAYEKECKNYHDFDPKENDIHPDKPENTNLKCPQCGQ